MKFLGWTIIRSANLARIHQRNRDLDADNKSLKAQVEQLEERIEAYKVKTSRVNLSALENELANYRRKYPDEKILLDNELRNTDGVAPSLLQKPLVQTAVQAAPGDTAIVLEPQKA